MITDLTFGIVKKYVNILNFCLNIIGNIIKMKKKREVLWQKRKKNLKK